MWSHYANAHQGICLIFNTEQSENNQNKQLILHDGQDNREIPFKFYEVSYEKKFPEVDFFNSIGRLSYKNLEETWLTCSSESVSRPSIKAYLGNEELWRNKYWGKFYNILTTKLEDWKYEEELRLIYSSGFESNSVGDTFKYNFKSLHGIIFGMKMSDEDQKQIISIISKKHEELQLDKNQFSFYQAYYSPTTGKIEKRKITPII